MDKESEYQQLLSSLTVKQRLFVEHYLEQLNGTAAAMLAGYKGSKNQLAVTGSKNIRKAKVKAAIDLGLEIYGKLSEHEVLSRISKIAQGDMSDYLTERTIKKATNSGQIYETDVIWFDIDRFRKDGFGYLIKRVRNSPSGGMDVEFHDPVKALELLGRHYKTFTDRIEGEAGGKINLVWDLEIPKEKPPPDD